MHDKTIENLMNKQNAKTSCRYLLLAVLFLTRLMAPTSVYAQLDEKFSDANDGLDIPFEITTIQNGEFASDTHWYSISVNSNKLWHTQKGSNQVYCSAVSSSELSDEFLWCFTGDNVSGFRIFNKAKGASQIAYAANGTTHDPIVMTGIGQAFAPRTFKVSKNGNGYNFYFPKDNYACINDLHGDGLLTLWVNNRAPENSGCRMTFNLISGDPDIPSDEGLPFKPTKKLEDGSLASSTHWYTMTIRGKKNIYAKDSKLHCEEPGNILEDQLWAFVGNAEDGFEIYNYVSGATYKVYASRGSNETPIVMENKTTSIGTYKWKLSDNASGGYNFHYPGYPTSCWNDFNNENWIGIWRSADAPKDKGSNIVFTEQNLNTVGEFVYVTAITLEPSSLSLFPGESAKLKYTLEPQNASNTSVWFFSQDEEICIVNNTTGEVTGVAPGTTQIGVYSLDGGYCYASCKVTVKDGSTLLEPEGPISYVFRTDGGVDAFPESYLSSMEESGGKLQITAKDGTSFTYQSDDYERVSNDAPTDFAQITSFKFNDKYNPDIIEDALGTIINDSIIQLTVAGIGKWLTPSFQLSDTTGARVYVADKLQKSKISRNSFKHEVIYTVSRENYQMLRTTAGGKFMMLPFGKDYRIQVDFLTDSPTGEYGVPAIYITTADGRPVSTKATYKDGTIAIDGGGVFPDMAEMPMQIKGRGNSSWSSNPKDKNPYHFKFSSKASVLGLKKGKHWNLIANKQYMSMMSNAIGMKVARMVGTQATNDFIPVELYVNGEYRGSYNLTEKVGFGNNSLDVSDTLENAVLMELDTYYDEVNKFKTATTYYSLPVNIKEPEFEDKYIWDDEKKKEFIDNIKRRFITGFLRALKQGTGVESHANVQSMATFLMTNELVVNYELMHPKSTYYFCRDVLNADSLIHFGPVWDLDWGFGFEKNHNYFYMNPTEDYWTGASNMEAWQYARDLRYKSGEAFEREYFRVWTDFIQNHLQELLDFCDEYREYAQPSFDHNSELWGYADYEEQMKIAKEWLTARANHIYDHLANTLGYAEKYPDVVNDPTPILDIAEDETQQSTMGRHIYTIDGRMVNAEGRLPRGIYIINGRKVVIQ